MLKLNKYIFALILPLFFILTACQNNTVNEAILNDADNFVNEPELKENNFLKEYRGDDFSSEESYFLTDTRDFDGINSPLYTFFNNDRYYFSVKKKYETIIRLTGREIFSYVDLKIGEKHYICSDPLCTHTEIEECKYLNLAGNIFFSEKNIFYIASIDGLYDDSNKSPKRWSIYKIDLNKDRVNIVFQTEEDFTKNDIQISAIYSNKLYFIETKKIESESERLSADIRTLKVLDLDTYKVVEIKAIPSEYANKETSLIYINENMYYFHSLKDIFTTDFNIENKKIIYSFAPNEYVSDYFFDENIGELYFLVRNNKKFTGNIYVYSNNELKKVNIPHENISAFQLTNSKIYYSPYEPLYYGMSPPGLEVYDYTGGQIYESDRDNLTESKLIFNSGQDFTIMTDARRYIIIGDYLYFNCMELIDNGAYVYFSSAFELQKVRINLKENTIKYLKFD